MAGKKKGANKQAPEAPKQTNAQAQQAANQKQ